MMMSAGPFEEDGRLNAENDGEGIYSYSGTGGWANDSIACNIPGLGSASTLYEVYLRSDPKYTGNITTPVLFDSTSMTIVSNDSKDICRISAGYLP